jgi:hypothetical protein
MVPVAVSSTRPAGNAGLTEKLALLPETELRSGSIGTPTVAERVDVAYVRLDGATTGLGGGTEFLMELDAQPLIAPPIVATLRRIAR